MTSKEVEAIKQTPLPAQQLVIVTVKYVGPYSLRPYRTFALD